MSDYIKREDAIDVIVKHFALNVSRSYVENILDDIPSADVHGERKKITNDYINKASTRDAFCHDCKGVSYRDCEYADTCHTQKVLTKQPSAEVVERKRGEWIRHKGFGIDDDYYPSKFECSECHHYIMIGFDNSFCPNCGCQMNGEEK